MLSPRITFILPLYLLNINVSDIFINRNLCNMLSVLYVDSYYGKLTYVCIYSSWYKFVATYYHIMYFILRCCVINIQEWTDALLVFSDALTSFSYQFIMLNYRWELLYCTWYVRCRMCLTARQWVTLSSRSRKNALAGVIDYTVIFV